MYKYLLSIILILITSCTRYPSTLISTDYGGLYHKPSGIIFPESIDDFQRGAVLIDYVNSELLTVEYNLIDTNRLTNVSMYLYNQRINGDFTRLDEEYENMKKLTKRLYPYTSHYSEKDTIIFVGDTKYNVKSIELEYMGYPNKEKKSLAYLFTFKGWFIKFGITYNFDSPPNEIDLIYGVLNNMKLPTKKPTININ